MSISQTRAHWKCWGRWWLFFSLSMSRAVVYNYKNTVVDLASGTGWREEGKGRGFLPLPGSHPGFERQRERLGVREGGRKGGRGLNKWDSNRHLREVEQSAIELNDKKQWSRYSRSHPLCSCVLWECCGFNPPPLLCQKVQTLKWEEEEEGGAFWFSFYADVCVKGVSWHAGTGGQSLP